MSVSLDNRRYRRVEINIEETRKQLNALQRAYASGVLKVQYSDRFVIYRSLLEMEKIIRSLEASLGLKKPGIQTIQVISGKGL